MINPNRVLKLFESIVSSFVILDDCEEILYATEPAKDINSLQNIKGKSFKEVYGLDLEKILSKKITYKPSSGEIYSVSAKKINSGQDRLILVTFDNLVDFNCNSVKLHCLEEIINMINDGVIISDYKGNLVLYNKSQEKLENLKSKDVVGKYLWEAYNYNPEISEHRKVFKSGKPIINAYRAHAHENGIPKYVSYCTYPIRKDGETIAVYTISRNETSLKNLLHEIIELKRKLFTADPNEKEIPKSNGTIYTFKDIKSQDPTIIKLIKESQTISLATNNLLIIGETGTGKELFAQSIHNFGQNQREPFIAINCAAIPENLLESTLFGTVKGSYTGAVDQMGFFEASGEGTLFLDEIHSLSFTLQAKLLRVIEEKLVRRVGGLNAIPIKCRLICAANNDPVELIEQNRLRKDFFYRIAGAILQIPPLRQRKNDIIFLADFFIEKYNKLNGKQINRLSSDLKTIFLTHDWPGNIRELEHIVESMIIKADEKESELKIDDLPEYFIKTISIDDSIKRYKTDRKRALPVTLRTIEEHLIRESLESNDWNFTKTAKDLGIIRQSLNYRMKKLHIKKPEK